MTNDEIIKKLEEQLHILERVQENAERLRNFQAMIEISDRIVQIMRIIKFLKGKENGDIFERR